MFAHSGFHIPGTREFEKRGEEEESTSKPWVAASQKPTAFTLTMNKPHRDPNPFCFPKAALEQGHSLSPTVTHTLPVASNIMGWQFLLEFQLHLSTCPPSMMLCWVVFAFGAPTRRYVLQEKEEAE